MKTRHLLEIGWTYAPGAYTLLIAIAMGSGVLPMLLVGIQTIVIDLASSHSLGDIGIFASVLITYFLLNTIDMNSQNVISYLQFKICSKIEISWINDFFNMLTRISFPDYDNSINQDVIYRIKTSIKQIIQQSVNCLPNIIIYFVGLVGIFSYLIPTNTWWIIPISILLSIPSLHFNRKRVQYARKVWEHNSFNARYSDYLHKMLIDRRTAKERKLFQFADYLEQKWDKTFKELNKDKISNYTKSSLATGIAMCFSMSNILIFGVALISPLQQGEISLGLYVSLMQMIITKFNFNLNSLIREISDLEKIKHFLADIYKLKSFSFVEKKESVRSISFESLEFDHVHFSYPGSNKQVLNGVSFKICKGDHCALIGVNGAGKTTITKLMLGLYKPTQGNILLNGINIDQYTDRELLDLYACMQQDTVNYKMTARENIGLYRDEKDCCDEELDNLLRDNYMNELKDAFTDGYNTLLTPELEDGIFLSGGQWQKVSLARTLFAKRDFYILDEPTAPLDPIAEVNFYQHFKDIMGESTVFYITHRLGSTYLFDKCLVLSNGIIEESGSHEELMNKENGIYKSLYTLQRKWYETGDAPHENN